MRDPRPILLVEDDIVDVTIVQRTFEELKIQNSLIHFDNGLDALEYLRSEDSQKPSLIFLDLNILGMDGIELLKILKSDDVLRKYPVIVITTSTKELDKAETFDLSVAGFIVKPINREQLIESIKIIDTYWTISELPA
jgi:CheY-like chemotaxis protein